MKSKKIKPSGIVKKNNKTPFFPKQKKTGNPISKARKQALKRLERAYKYLNGNSPLESRTKKSRGLELAKKLISPDIQQVDTISEVLNNMIHILSAGNNFSFGIEDQQHSLESATDASIYLSQSFFDKDQESQVRKLIQEAAAKTQLGNSGQQKVSGVYDCAKDDANDFYLPGAWSNYIHCLLALPKEKSEVIIETVSKELIEEEESEEGNEEDDNDEDDNDEDDNDNSDVTVPAINAPGVNHEEQTTEVQETGIVEAVSEEPFWRRFLNRLSNFFNR